MALELKDATGKCKSLEEDNKAKAGELDKALQKARQAQSKSRAAREEIQQAGEIAAGNPFLLQTKFSDLKYAPLNQMWSSPDTFLDLPKSVLMRRGFTERKKDMQQRSFSGRNSACQSVRCC